MNKYILICFILFLPTTTFAQKKNVQVDLKIDSLLKVINYQSNKNLREYNRKIDSTNNAAYIQALERSNVLQAGNNTYYSWVGGGLTLVITIIVIVFGFNYFKSKRDFDKQLKDHREFADSIYKEMSKTISDQQEKIQTLHEETKNTIQDLVKRSDEKLKGVDEQTFTPDAQKILKDVKEDVERVKTLSELSADISKFTETLPQRIFALRCPNCQKVYAAKNAFTVCPYCSPSNVWMP